MFGEIVFDGKLILTGICVVDCFKFIGGRVLKLDWLNLWLLSHRIPTADYRNCKCLVPVVGMDD